MTAVFSFTPPFAEHKVHRNLYWFVCAWGIIAIWECPCDASHEHYDKMLSNMTVVWHFSCTQVRSFLLWRIAGLCGLEGPQEFIRPGLWLRAGAAVRSGQGPWGFGESGLENLPFLTQEKDSLSAHFRITGHVSTSSLYIPTERRTAATFDVSIWADQFFFYFSS